MTSVLGNICVVRWVCCDYSLLKGLESIGFRLVAPDALEKGVFGDAGAFGIYLAPFRRQRVDDAINFGGSHS